MSDIGKDGWPTDTTVIRGRDRELESLRSRLSRLEEVYATTVDCWKADGERLAEVESQRDYWEAQAKRTSVEAVRAERLSREQGHE